MAVFLNNRPINDNLSTQQLDDLERLYKTLSPQKSFDRNRYLTNALQPQYEVYLMVVDIEEDQQQIVGMATLAWISFGQNTKGYIEDVAVLEAFQRQGRAARLVSRIICRARELDIDTLWLTSSDKRAPAQVVYRKLGFVEPDTRLFYFDLRSPSNTAKLHYPSN